MNNRRLLTLCVCAMMAWATYAQSFETAAEAVKNMGVGWNLGNTLDACNGGACPDIVQSETMWGQPITKPELMKMMKKAGFGAIRVPVTWYPHMDEADKVDEAWMKRVHEVVDYVLDNGMYCILNVHHDTGEGARWLHANMSTYNSVKARYEYLWQQIAESFKDYSEKLLFESYNEMLDEYDSWCFASYASPNKYNATSAADSYEAINNYAQSFVNVVRATGGNNTKRNLIVNTYGACSGGGTWNSHLADPLKEMALPEDATAGSGHIAFEVHAYPTLANGKSEANDIFSKLDTYLLPKAPVIMGEWGTSNVDAAESDYVKDPKKYLEFVQHFVEKAKEKGVATFYWMGLSDGLYRIQPAFNQPDIAKTIIQAYYGSTDAFNFPTVDGTDSLVCFEGEKALGWGNGISISNSAFGLLGNTAQLMVSYIVTDDSTPDIQLYYGDWSAKLTFDVDGKTYNEDYNPSGGSGTAHTCSITFSESVFTLLTQKGLIIHGSGVTLTKAVLQRSTTAVHHVCADARLADQRIYTIGGFRVTQPRNGVYIKSGKKFYSQ